MHTRDLARAGVLFTLVAVASCAATPEPVKVAATRKGIEAADVERRANPCDDFYEYANGAWRAENPIPTGKARWSRRAAGREANRERVRALVQEISTRTDWPVGSAGQIVGDHYAACMDDAAGGVAAVTPVASLLTEIDKAKTSGDVQRIIRRLHDLGIAAAFGETGAYDYHESQYFRLNLVAGTPAHAGKKDDVAALESRLAAASLDPKIAADPAATEHKTTFAELKAMAPHIEWETYFDEAHLPRDPINVAEPKLLQQVDKELASTPIATWKAYLRRQLLDAFTIKDETQPRAQRCVESLETLLGEPIGRVYADKYFTPAAKAKTREIASGLLAVVKEDVANVSWMAADTKKQALAKATSMSVQVGYPDQWKDLSSLHIRRDAFWANVAQARTFSVNDMRRQIGKPTDRNSWLLAPSSPDAYLDPQLNELVLPAGFLQPPYFDVDATDAMNYGALGSGLAHDMTHAFDVTGSLFDAMGHPNTWWTDADRIAFQQRTQCIVDQYEGYAIEPGVHHQGKLVLNEALGDQAGIHIAFRALEKSMAAHPVPTVDGFTPEQQFFLAWGQFRGEAVRIETQREIVKSDPHAVPKFRVIGPLSNLPEFAQAFSCKAGTPMVRAPEQRCAVW
jgi:putative endopeptidase